MCTILLGMGGKAERCPGLTPARFIPAQTNTRLSAKHHHPQCQKQSNLIIFSHNGLQHSHLLLMLAYCYLRLKV